MRPPYLCREAGSDSLEIHPWRALARGRGSKTEACFEDPGWAILKRPDDPGMKR